MRLLILFVLLLVVGWVYVRFAPADNATWHVDPVTAKSPGKGGYRITLSTLETPKNILKEIGKIASDTPRMKILTGSIDAGRITYVARSAVFGFPDYVTVQATADDTGSTVTILGRLRFGRSDFQVNRSRINTWIERLQGLGLINE